MEFLYFTYVSSQKHTEFSKLCNLCQCSTISLQVKMFRFEQNFLYFNLCLMLLVLLLECIQIKLYICCFSTDDCRMKPWKLSEVNTHFRFFTCFHGFHKHHMLSSPFSLLLKQDNIRKKLIHIFKPVKKPSNKFSINRQVTVNTKYRTRMAKSVRVLVQV